MVVITNLIELFNEDGGNSIFYFFAACMVAMIISAWWLANRSFKNPENTFNRYFDENGDEFVKNKKGKLVKKGSHIRDYT
jgi:hypothetical protein|tara:strand:- start:592 stop:831 length:240 start_codon:yes stop_codon:yes gene_type:complete